MTRQARLFRVRCNALRARVEIQENCKIGGGTTNLAGRARLGD